MKLCLSVFLSLVILLANLFPNMDTHEFNEMSELVQHYKEHQQRQKGEEISFVKFIAMHYLDAGHDQSEDHSNLPFKHQHHGCAGTFFTVLPTFSFSFHTSCLVFKKEVVHTPLISFYQSVIWQPPKV